MKMANYESCKTLTHQWSNNLIIGAYMVITIEHLYFREILFILFNRRIFAKSQKMLSLSKMKIAIWKFWYSKVRTVRNLIHLMLEITSVITSKHCFLVKPKWKVLGFVEVRKRKYKIIRSEDYYFICDLI